LIGNSLLALVVNKFKVTLSGSVIADLSALTTLQWLALAVHYF